MYVYVDIESEFTLLTRVNWTHLALHNLCASNPNSCTASVVEQLP